MFKKLLLKIIPVAAAISARRAETIAKGKILVKNQSKRTEEEREIIGFEYKGKTKYPIIKLKENEVETGRSLDDSIVYIINKYEPII